MPLSLLVLVLLTHSAHDAAQKPAAKALPGGGPIVVLETAKGTIEFETYPEDAPKTVAHFLNLVRRDFYRGLRFHRVDANFVIQVGDPLSRDMSKQDLWGRSGRGSGRTIGAAEFSRKRTHVVGAVGAAYATDPKLADSQFYITLRATPELDGRYAVFGRVISGMDVVRKIEKTDLLRRAYVKGETPKP
jgi:cyclophilin family peptidyl-prolyl cis-trans isomerase